MKKLLLCLALLLGALTANAQKQELTDFLASPPWWLAVNELEANYPGTELYPLLEALYPAPVDIALFPDDMPTLAGFTFAGHDAYVSFAAENYQTHFSEFIAFLSPETTMGDTSMGIYTTIVHTLDTLFGPAIEERYDTSTLDESTTLVMGDFWKADEFSLCPIYITSTQSDAPVYYGIMCAYDGIPREDALKLIAAEEALKLIAVEEGEYVDEDDELTDEEIEEAAFLLSLVEGTAPHLKFRNVELYGTLEEFCSALQAIGYVRQENYVPTPEYAARLTGKYGNLPCEIYVAITPISQVVYGVDVRLGHSTRWGELKKTFALFEGLFEKKYVGGERDEQYGSPYFDGCGTELMGIREEWVVFRNEFANYEDGVGFITLSIESEDGLNGWVCISFADYNILLARAELEELI